MGPGKDQEEWSGVSAEGVGMRRRWGGGLAPRGWDGGEGGGPALTHVTCAF